MMTKQQIFDTVIAHARAQCCKATSTGGQHCLYRAADGKKCFVGALIPNDRYDPEIEGEGVSDIQRRYPDIFPAEAVILLRDLQRTHDKNSPENWEPLFARVAAYHSLTYTGVQS